jgi:hypothetical protein
MLEEQRWGLAILVSQKLVRALPKPMWGAWGGPFQNPRGVLGEGPSKTHVGCLGRTSGEALSYPYDHAAVLRPCRAWPVLCLEDVDIRCKRWKQRLMSVSCESC